jgi:hypothetical protein
VSNFGIYLVGGSKSFGSGKVVTFIRKSMNELGLLTGFIETQGARQDIFYLLFKIPKNAQVLFQPSICFPAFLRDVLILIIMRIRGNRIIFILMVDVVFNNPLLKSRFLRSLFFGKSTVLGIAEFSQFIKRSVLIQPYFDSSMLNRLNIAPTLYAAPLTVLHLGYRNKMKGWIDLRDRLIQEEYPFRVVAIGGKVTKIEARNVKPIELMPGMLTTDIENSLRTICVDSFPVYLFLSKEDFAPLMVLESGFWGIPVATLRGTYAADILQRMLPDKCFLVVDKVGDLDKRKDELLMVRQFMDEYLLTITPNIFLKKIINQLDLRPR